LILGKTAPLVMYFRHTRLLSAVNWFIKAAVAGEHAKAASL
jgi:hypothetical protein